MARSRKAESQTDAVISGTFGSLFGGPTARMLDVLILHRGYDLSLKELAAYSGLGSKTVWQNLPTLLESRLVKRTRSVGNAKMVALDETSDVARSLVEAEFKLPLAQEPGGRRF